MQSYLVGDPVYGYCSLVITVPIPKIQYGNPWAGCIIIDANSPYSSFYYPPATELLDKRYCNAWLPSYKKIPSPCITTRTSLNSENIILR